MSYNRFSTRAYLTSYLYNAAKSGHLAEYFQTLTDFQFLQDKINYPGLGVQSLIEDYDLIEQLDANSEQVETLKLIQDTLRLSAHVLEVDSSQLASQLWGRLVGFTALSPQQPVKPNSDIEALLKQAQENPTYPRLLPYTPTLTPPGTPLIRTLTGHSSSVRAVCVTPNGKRIISGSDDNTLKVWELATGKVLHTLTGHSNSVYAVCVTPDGKRVISGSMDKTLKVWDLETGKELHSLTSHRSRVLAVCVTPDGKRVISASWDKTLKVWKLETGKVLHTLKGHSNSVYAVCVTPDGKRVISGSMDKTLKVWDLETGKELHSLTGHSGWVRAVCVTPDGKRVISGSRIIPSRCGNWKREGITHPHRS